MLIHVMYPVGTYDYVREFMLNNLIETGKIVKFRRSGGWVSLGEGRIRTESLRCVFCGVEKRATVRPINPEKNVMFQTEFVRSQ